MHRGRVILSDLIRACGLIGMESKRLWMVVLVAFLLGGWCDGCWEQEKTALLQLNPFFGQIWGVETQSSNCCEWDRVECNTSTGRVMRLFLNHTFTKEAWDDLSYVYYDDTWSDDWYLNASLFLPFEELNSLYLRGNSIAGCVYNEGFDRLSSKLSKLEILDLSSNHFNDSILSSLSELSSLKSLNLAGNRFTGSNPTYGIGRLSKLNNLEILNLDYNKLRNHILSYLDNFTSLKSLSLQNCGLKGTVDMLEFNNLINLKELYLGENEIQSLGSLFQNKEQLRLIKLEVLGLSENLFNNNIFSYLMAFSNLKSLFIRSNKLKGPIYIKELNALSNLEELYMGDNEVNDFITSKDNETELRLINLEVLDLSGNLFNNSILSFLGRLSNLKSLFLEGNNLEGSIDLTVLNALSNLKELFMACRFPGGLRNTACSLSPKSPGVFLPSLKTLILAGFSFNGTMTTQKLHNFRNLEELILGDSFLQTNFLRNFGELTSLKRLKLYGCEINNIGSLTPPQGPLHLNNLEFLGISDTSLENNFLQKIGAMPSLKFLYLQSCEHNGTLLTQGFCEMTNLQELDINDNNLKDYLPECFSNLTSLERLDLRSNQFFGNISVLKSLTTLKSLDLSSNQFSGSISALDSLTSLQVLSISNNYFQIPSSLGPFFNLSKLKYLYADNNTIYAETEMHSLAPTFQLKEITMACCGNGGSFPQFLYHQKDLQTVDLSNIYFKGDQFPNWLLKNNTKLARLFLANSSLSGPIQLPLPSHLGLSSLDISNNFFNGSIPIEIGAQLPSLNFLNMSKNHFNGSIPSSFGDMSSLCSLDLSNNLLSGGIPQHMAMGCSSLAYLALSNNTLQGKLFSVNFSLTNLMELQLDGNNFSGRIPDFLSNKTYLNTLDVSNNQLSGRIPRWMGNMSSLETIIMSNNHLEGTIPMEFCQLDLILLDLSVNNISGSLPSCFSPSQIRQVHLSKNRLRGSLPDSLGNCSTLVTLDVSDNFLTGNIPSWIGRLSNLSYLLLNNNKFEGWIPIELCNLSHLSLINLSHNNLSGRIPPCIKITTLEDVSEDYVRGLTAAGPNPAFSFNEAIEFTTKNISYSYKGKILPYMSGIDLSFNNLVGEIPDEIGNFRNILVLSLSHNSLTGPIPPTFANLLRIESLDLSYNKLSGNIPPEFAVLHFLSYFNVSYNNLSGKTPERVGQLGAFDESSYLGNPFLCGTLVQKNCSPIEPPLTPKASNGNRVEDGSIDMGVFYVSFIVSYLIVLLSIAVVLYINPYWRQAWFYHVEMAVNSCYYFVVDNLPRQFLFGYM